MLKGMPGHRAEELAQHMHTAFIIWQRTSHGCSRGCWSSIRQLQRAAAHASRNASGYISASSSRGWPAQRSSIVVPGRILNLKQ